MVKTKILVLNGSIFSILFCLTIYTGCKLSYLRGKVHSFFIRVEPKIYLISTVEINKKWSPCFRSIYFSMLQKRIWVERIRVWTGGTRSSLWWCCRWVSFFIFLFIIIICFINTLDKCQKWLKQHRFNLEHVQFTMVPFKPFISFTEIFFK